MKTIICGSRSFKYPEAGRFVGEAIGRVPWEITEVVSGCAPGPDRQGLYWADWHGVPVKRFAIASDEAAAGVRRNSEMADYADACIAIWDGESRGTKDMIDKARRAGLKVSVYRPHLEEKQEVLF